MELLCGAPEQTRAATILRLVAASDARTSPPMREMSHKMQPRRALMAMSFRPVFQTVGAGASITCERSFRTRPPQLNLRTLGLCDSARNSNKQVCVCVCFFLVCSRLAAFVSSRWTHTAHEPFGSLVPSGATCAGAAHVRGIFLDFDEQFAKDMAPSEGMYYLDGCQTYTQALAALF